jgi:predicted acetyltransferase
VARERGFVVSALMPFRGSFYERFGYGYVERRTEWTVPMAVLPKGDFDDVRFYDHQRDFDALVAFKQRITEAGHCDIERPPFLWEHYLKYAEEGFMVVDRAGDGPIRGCLYFASLQQNMLDHAKVEDLLYEDVPTLRRLLRFLGSLRDQYSSTALTVPGEARLNLLLSETQMTHRAKRNHPTAEARPFNRMQVRVLDNAKLLSAMRRLPVGAKGKAVVAIREPEGETTTLTIDLADGRGSAVPSSATPAIECTAHVWAAVVLGDLSATEAARLGLLAARDGRALSVLDAFAAGPAPCCNEYF